MSDSNLHIVQRLAELVKNQLEYSEYPKGFKEEYIFLPNHLNCAVHILEREFDEAFRYAVGNYKQSLEQNKEYGWFHGPEKMLYIRMQINQLLYVIYGERFVSELKFKEELGNEAYKDLLLQIDPTILMSDGEKKAHMEECDKIASEILAEFLAEEKADKKN